MDLLLILTYAAICVAIFKIAALVLLILVAVVIFYGIIVLHDIPYEIAERRRQGLRLGQETGAIDRVADQRMADMGHMHPDLVGATGFQLAPDQRGDGGQGAGKPLLRFIAGEGRLATGFDDGAFEPVVFVAVKRRVDHALCRHRRAA